MAELVHIRAGRGHLLVSLQKPTPKGMVSWLYWRGRYLSGSFPAWGGLAWWLF